MRIQILSDLHADVRPPRPITVAPNIDAVIVAGDVCEGAEKGFVFLRQFVPMQVPIIAVLGNHEYYRRCHGEELADARRAAPLYGVHLMENDVVELGGVRFVGATLWTDYAVFGEANAARAMQAAADGLNDHRRIKWQKKPWRRFRPAEALRLHQDSRAFIASQLSSPFAGPTVVVTHHAPHVGSLHPRHGNEVLSAAYVSDLAALIEGATQPTGAPGPALWVHGHVHSSFDYTVGVTRILCNPHGYGSENPAFDPALVVEVGS